VVPGRFRGVPGGCWVGSGWVPGGFRVGSAFSIHPTWKGPKVAIGKKHEPNSRGETGLTPANVT